MAVSDDELGALLYPFVVVESVGGPYHDDSFAAGWACGALAAEMARHGTISPRYVRSEVVAQLDLVAMSEGYLLTADPWVEHPDEWSLVTLTRASTDAP